MKDNHETISDIAQEMRGFAKTGDDTICVFADRIEAAFNRELDGVLWRLKQYEDAVKPLLEYDFGDYMPPWKPLRINGESIRGAVTTEDGHAFSLIEECIFGIDAMVDMANLIGALQKELKPPKGEEADCG